MTFSPSKLITDFLQDAINHGYIPKEAESQLIELSSVKKNGVPVTAAPNENPVQGALG